MLIAPQEVSDGVASEPTKDLGRSARSRGPREVVALPFARIIGRSPAIMEVLRQVEQVAPTEATVLLLGETGTGKELIARAIHDLSPRRDGPLVKLNCAALPPGLVESELFGHERGAFTGALERRIGRFALADGGTIFLDEVGDMPLEAQLRLLRVLQEREFEPVGAPAPIRVDVRVVAATNRDLDQAMERGTFRRDLFYRVNVFPIRVPALRDRRDDIPMLIEHFVGLYAARMGKTFRAIGAETVDRLVSYDWPGNIRELMNVVERAVILSADVLEVEPSAVVAKSPSKGSADRDRILRALDDAEWVIEGKRGAAQALGVPPNTLRSRMKKLGIKREPE